MRLASEPPAGAPEQDPTLGVSAQALPDRQAAGK
jgi:hypothetical protein